MNKAYKAALIRGATGGFFLAGSAFFAAAPTQGPLTAFYVFGGIWFGYMATRFAEAKVTGDANKE